jgi:hypothetical protein
VPLSPVTVERIRAAMLNPLPRQVQPSKAGQRKREAYELAPPGTPQPHTVSLFARKARLDRRARDTGRVTTGSRRSTRPQR